MEKFELRKKLLAIRKNFRDDESPKIIEEFLKLPELEKSQSIFTYLPTRDEVQIDSLIKKLISLGKKFSIPHIVSKNEMVATELDSFENLVMGKFGIRSVKNPIEIDPAEIDLIIVPGLGFDRNGNRLGLGGGFYDRFLQKTPRAVKIALAFQFQLVPNIPTESHDQKIDALITIEGVIRF